MATMRGWRRDGNDMEGKMNIGRGGRGWGEDQKIANAKTQNQE